MDDKGFVVQIDDFGRIYLDKMIRGELGWNENDFLRVFLCDENEDNQPDSLFIRKDDLNTEMMCLDMLDSLIFVLNKEDKDYSATITALNQVKMTL